MNLLLFRKKLIHSQVIVSISEIRIIKNASEELASHQNSTRVFDYTCDENGINLLDTQK